VLWQRFRVPHEHHLLRRPACLGFGRIQQSSTLAAQQLSYPYSQRGDRVSETINKEQACASLVASGYPCEPLIRFIESGSLVRITSSISPPRGIAAATKRLYWAERDADTTTVDVPPIPLVPVRRRRRQSLANTSNTC
jgi:hypothetical protein